MLTITDGVRLGALLGVLVGDAAGATLEFSSGTISKAKAERAMRMPGGGRIDVAPGQITDDGELTLALLGALVRSPADGQFPADAVALAYSRWHLSRPFDCGVTCTKAMGSLYLQQRLDGAPVPNPGAFMKTKAAEYNAISEANGALMRCVPIPFLCWRQPYSKIADWARQDALLTHPNEACQDCNAMYAVTVAYLIKTSDDTRQRSLDALRHAVSDLADKANIGSKTRAWLATALTREPDECTTNIGHVKHAMQLAFYHLARQSSFEDGIRDTLMRGGDTDTNAAIVGGMLGALHGVNAIPKYMLRPVLLFDCSKHDPMVSGNGYRRPAEYSASRFSRLFPDLAASRSSPQ